MVFFYVLDKLLGVGSSALFQVLRDLFKWVPVITTSKTLETQFAFFLSTPLPSLLHNFRCGQASFLTIFQLKYYIWLSSVFQNISLALWWDAHSCILHVMPLGSSCPHCHASCQFSLLLFFSIGCLPYSAIYLYYLFISIFISMQSLPELLKILLSTTWTQIMFSTVLGDDSLRSLTLWGKVPQVACIASI